MAREIQYKGVGGFPLNTFVTHPIQYADGSSGNTPPAPVPKGNNPFFEWDAEQQKFVPIPGSPADK